MKLTISLLIVVCSGVLAQEPSPVEKAALTNFKKLKDGDLVFISSNSPRAALIQKLTGSIFSHCGIVFLNDEGGPCVFEGAGANSDIHKPIDQWQTDESKPDSGSKIHLVYARRLKGGLTGDQVKTLKAEAAKMHRTRYDFAFQMGDPKDNQAGRQYIYCSELIYRAFQSINVILGDPLSFGFYYKRAGEGPSGKKDQEEMNKKLNAEEVRQLRNPPGPYRMDEFVISPKDIYDCDKLEDVTNETPD